MYSLLFAMYQEEQRIDIMWRVSVARDIKEADK